jgi:hypothetical protein
VNPRKLARNLRHAGFQATARDLAGTLLRLGGVPCNLEESGYTLRITQRKATGPEAPLYAIVQLPDGTWRELAGEGPDEVHLLKADLPPIVAPELTHDLHLRLDADLYAWLHEYAGRDSLASTARRLLRAARERAR